MGRSGCIKRPAAAAAGDGAEEKEDPPLLTILKDNIQSPEEIEYPNSMDAPIDTEMLVKYKTLIVAIRGAIEPMSQVGAVEMRELLASLASSKEE
eukprot:7508065-Pyramimonas_sp.AAC.1